MRRKINDDVDEESIIINHYENSDDDSDAVDQFNNA